MTILRKCPVCLSTVNSGDSTRCVECGAVLDRENSAADSIAVDDIIKKVKQQITPLDDTANVQPPGAGSVDGKDISEVLSDDAFQSILHESRGKEEASPVEDAQASPEMPAGQGGQAGVSAGAYPGQSDAGFGDAEEERLAPFSTVLGSFKQAHSPSEMDDAQHDAMKSSPNADQEFDPEMAASDSRSGHRDQPEQVPPAAPKRRTWWGTTRQTLWLLVVLLGCIVFFRIFGPEKKEPTIEDFFRPGTPDIKFLDAIEFLEKYYERHPDKRVGNAGTQADEAFAGSMQLPQPVDRTDAEPTGQALDNSTPRDPFSPASREPTP